MSRYRRARVPGGCFFFTVVLADRGSRLLVEEIGALREAWASVARERPFETRAAVVLPDHLHAVWQLPEGDGDFSSRWKAIKGRFSRAVGGGAVRPSLARKGERGVWQRRFWERALRDDRDLAAHVEYCRTNPVKHGLVERPEDWPYSSFARRP